MGTPNDALFYFLQSLKLEVVEPAPGVFVVQPGRERFQEIRTALRANEIKFTKTTAHGFTSYSGRFLTVKLKDQRDRVIERLKART